MMMMTTTTTMMMMMMIIIIIIIINLFDECHVLWPLLLLLLLLLLLPLCMFAHLCSSLIYNWPMGCWVSTELNKHLSRVILLYCLCYGNVREERNVGTCQTEAYRDAGCLPQDWMPRLRFRSVLREERTRVT
jgi:hypothetical protein